MNSRVVHAIRPWCIRLKRMDVQTLSIVNVAEHDREQTFATTQFYHSNDQFFYDPSFEKLFIHTIMITARIRSRLRQK